MAELTGDKELRRVLEEVKTIAVLGAHADEDRPSHYVPDYLFKHGYRIIPVNPKYAGKSMWNETVRKDLTEIDESVDMVDVFRPSRALEGHLPEFLGMRSPPKVIWFQLGIRNDDVAGQLVDRGIDVVQDHCALAEHERLIGE